MDREPVPDGENTRAEGNALTRRLEYVEESLRKVQTQPAPVSDAERHYSELTAYFKHLVWLVLLALGIIITAGGVFLYQSATDLRERTAAAQREAENAIGRTRDAADSQIKEIGESARRIAIEEAQRKVGEVFETSNVSQLVESAARAQAKTIIEQELGASMDRAIQDVQRDLDSLGEVSDAASSARVGHRSGLDRLMKIRATATQPKVGELAGRLIARIAADYGTSMKDAISEMGAKDAIDLLRMRTTARFGDGPEVVCALIKEVETGDDLNNVALEFISLEERTGHQLRIFDFEALNAWSRRNAANCGR